MARRKRNRFGQFMTTVPRKVHQLPAWEKYDRKLSKIDSIRYQLSERRSTRWGYVLRLSAAIIAMGIMPVSNLLGIISWTAVFIWGYINYEGILVSTTNINDMSAKLFRAEKASFRLADKITNDECL